MISHQLQGLVIQHYLTWFNLVTDSIRLRKLSVFNAQLIESTHWSCLLLKFPCVYPSELYTLNSVLYNSVTKYHQGLLLLLLLPVACRCCCCCCCCGSTFVRLYLQWNSMEFCLSRFKIHNFYGIKYSSSILVDSEKSPWTFIWTCILVLNMSVNQTITCLNESMKEIGHHTLIHNNATQSTDIVDDSFFCCCFILPLMLSNLFSLIRRHYSMADERPLEVSWPLMPQWFGSLFGTGNGVLNSHTKPLFESMLHYGQLDS